jgi:hypothetical protein
VFAVGKHFDKGTQLNWTTIINHDRIQTNQSTNTSNGDNMAGRRHLQKLTVDYASQTSTQPLQENSATVGVTEGRQETGNTKKQMCRWTKKEPDSWRRRRRNVEVWRFLKTVRCVVLNCSFWLYPSSNYYKITTFWKLDSTSVIRLKKGGQKNLPVGPPDWASLQTRISET